MNGKQYLESLKPDGISHTVLELWMENVQIINPPNSGTFYNYKDNFSIVIMALLDADYQFIDANVGVQGRISDGDVFNHSSLHHALCSGALGIPTPEPLYGRANSSPYVIVADDAFALQENLMKPYPGSHNKGSKERIFNYRLSRARRIVENAFGILSAVFRVLRKPTHLNAQKATFVTLCCMYLHNYLRSNRDSRSLYSPPGSFDFENIEKGSLEPGVWRAQGEPLVSLRKSGKKKFGKSQASEG